MPTLDAIAPLRFGRFLLEPSRRLLSIDNEPVQLSSRAFDILTLLAENRDRIVSKDEIFASVWRGVAVEDNNLAVQMSALRRALAEPAGDPKIILTIPGRGYRFIAPITDAEPAPPPPSLAAPEPIAALPEATAPLARPRHAVWPAAVACLIALPILAWLLLPQFRQPVAPRLSIVVLPFRNLSADPQQDYLADAISDDLTTDLSHIPGSVVIARESADVYKGKAVGAEVIGRALHVRYLLEGSIRNEGDTLHINAQLIDAANGAHLWASMFDLDRGHLGQARETIVRQIASALNFTLVSVESIRSLTKRPDDVDAMDFYFRARSVLDRSNTLAGLIEAQGLLERSVALEPDFSEGLAELGSILLRKISGFDDANEQQDYRSAQRVIQRAAELAPHAPATITAIGLLAAADHRCKEAQPDFRLALSIDSNYIPALTGLSRCARALGELPDLIANLKEMLRIDPRGPRNAVREQAIGMGYLMLGHPADALKWLDLAGADIAIGNAAESPLSWQDWRRIYKIAATEMLGRNEEAATMYVEYRRLNPHRTVWQLNAYDTRALCSLPGHLAYLAALHQAGMPWSEDEHGDYGITPVSEVRQNDDMKPTPLFVSGATTVDTQQVKAMLAQDPAILDFGSGVAVIPNAIWVWQAGLKTDLDQLPYIGKHATGHVVADRAIIVMSDGPIGWRSYNATLQIVANKYPHVYWYRGGEAAWAAARQPANDRRLQ